MRHASAMDHRHAAAIKRVRAVAIKGTVIPSACSMVVVKAKSPRNTPHPATGMRLCAR